MGMSLLLSLMSGAYKTPPFPCPPPKMDSWLSGFPLQANCTLHVLGWSCLPGPDGPAQGRRPLSALEHLSAGRWQSAYSCQGLPRADQARAQTFLNFLSIITGEAGRSTLQSWGVGGSALSPAE